MKRYVADATLTEREEENLVTEPVIALLWVSYVGKMLASA